MWFKKDKKGGRNVYMLLDRSGSMSTNWVETLGSINGYIKKLEDDVNIFLAAFDSSGTNDDYIVLRETTSRNFKPLTETEISTGGATPLYDAVGKISQQMISDNPERAVLVIMTDGYENASKEYNLSSVKSKLKELEHKDWPTVFLGADFKDVTNYTTSTFNINQSNVVNTTGATRGFALGIVADKTATYFNSATGSTASLNSMRWTDEEKAKVDGSTKIDVQKIVPLSTATTVDTSGHA